MDKKDFYFLGKVTKTSGYKGSLMFFFDVDDLSRYNDLEAVFIDIHGELIPFVINGLQFKAGSNTAYVSLEDVTDEEQASALVNCNLYLPVSFLPPLTGNKFYYHEVIGFTVIDKNFGQLGKITSVNDNGPQALISIEHSKKEILIPVSDEIIKKVDREKKVIEVETPEGLIEIYL
jgi:16S rRNA processing protein RimM